jgi:cytochrome b subunit of formate dehydrogenase
LLPAAQAGRQVQRFSAVWRAAHLVFALGLMLLALTGLPFRRRGATRLQPGR